jgi:hypothetical protein
MNRMGKEALDRRRGNGQPVAIGSQRSSGRRSEAAEPQAEQPWGPYRHGSNRDATASGIDDSTRGIAPSDEDPLAMIIPLAVRKFRVDQRFEAIIRC